VRCGYDVAMHDALTLAGSQAGRLASAPFAVLPLGSVEYHGPHAPLGTDTTLAVGFARRLAERFGAVLLPPIAYTFAPVVTSGLPGTLSVAAPALVAYLEEVLRALGRAGVRRVLALNGHSENQFALRLAAERVALEQSGLSVAIANWWRFVPAEASEAAGFSESGGHGHGGPLEIAATAAFDPGGIDPSLARDVAYEAPWWRTAAQVVGVGQSPVGFDGYHGRVSETTVAAGEVVVAAATEGLARFVTGWLARAADAEAAGARR
jgi:creatinine amidohydrolase